MRPCSWRESMPAKPLLPSVNSFLVADQVFQQTSGKWCIIGVFDRVLSPRYPTTLPALGLYVTLSDAEGVYDVRVEFRDSGDRVLAVMGGIHMEVSSRLAQVGFGVQTYSLPIPKAGRYLFRLFFNDEPAASDIVLESNLLEGTP